ncbi:HEPN domain-containing protein [Rhodobacter sp. CZR27]|uniref:HEPN domain-containing protein n=1 Tax=Rhodobacter sp. CZR27 TaxID=2033869 RepID=UPI0012FDCE2F|nr:HEPN domain-containing protein [Rhodobacter sp. CZR27]
MSFADAQLEVRGRFTEALQVINRLDPGAPPNLIPSTDPDKALRGLLLVAIYSAMERGVNAYVEEALAVATSHASLVKHCIPEVQAIFHYPRIQSLRDCSDDNSLSKSIELFSMLTQDVEFSVANNPLSVRLQNVDGSTMEQCCQFLGVPNFSIGVMERGRLNNLRERRNAVSHGRESSVQVGGRFSFGEIRTMHSIADTEVEKFGSALKAFFEQKGYELSSA